MADRELQLKQAELQENDLELDPTMIQLFPFCRLNARRYCVFRSMDKRFLARIDAVTKDRNALGTGRSADLNK